MQNKELEKDTHGKRPRTYQSSRNCTGGMSLITREDMKPWIIAALKAHGGKARVVQVCKYIWDHYENQIRNSGDVLYTWQYDVRWAAQMLRDEGVLRSKDRSKSRHWELA